MKTRKIVAVILAICLVIIGSPLINVQASEILKVGDNATAKLSSDVHFQDVPISQVYLYQIASQK